MQFDTSITFFHAMLGFLTIKGEKFLVLVSEIQDVGLIYQDHVSNVFSIKNVWFFSIKYDTDHSKLSSEIRNIITGITYVLQQGMYFSYHFDLTNTAQRATKYRGKSVTLFEMSDKQYVWNYAMCKDFINAKINSNWLTPLIQGYVGIIEEELKGKKLKLILISRRRTKRAGTRFNARGIDDDGNVANYVETEQVLLYNNNTYSFVQIRGSVPVFWSQSGVLSEISLTRTPEMAFPSFSKHFDHLVKLYSRVLIFNLLSDKEGEARLTRAYEANVKAYEKKENANIRYHYFNFHSERSTAKAIFN